METPRIRALNVEIGELKKIVDKLHGMLSQENFQYNLLESQFEGYKVRNEQLKAENDKAEEKLKEAVTSADNIIKVAQETANETKSNAVALYTRAQVKFQELSKEIEASERASIRKHLKELESVVS